VTSVLAMLAAPAVAEDKADEVVAAAPGRIEGASPIVLLGIAGTGVIKELPVAEGDHVKGGQVLLRLDCAPLEQELKVTAAKVSLAEARLVEAEKKHKRSVALQGTVSFSRIDETERDFRIAQAQLAQAREEVNWTKARLDDCSIKAPTDGVVLSTLAMPGQFVSATVPTPLLRFVDDRKLRVRAEVDERDLGKLCPRQVATITADGFPGVSLAATVYRINPGMGRRTVLSGDPAEKSDRDVREVMLSVDQGAQELPIGLRVVALFRQCLPTMVSHVGR